MFVYATLMLGKFNCVHQRSGLAVAGFMGVIMGIVVSYGICSAFGVFFGPMHSVLPFLLLGIGLDDMFVIAQSWDSLEIGQAHHMFSRILRTQVFFYGIDTYNAETQIGASSNMEGIICPLWSK